MNLRISNLLHLQVQLLMRKKVKLNVTMSSQIRPTNTGRIDIKGYEIGVSMPTNLPYSPRKLAFKGKTAMSSNQLIVEKEKRIGKLKAKRGGEEVA
ncbi:hypothetical protein H5410_022104, partial [Solanum commersonii]